MPSSVWFCQLESASQIGNLEPYYLEGIHVYEKQPESARKNNYNYNNNLAVIHILGTIHKHLLGGPDAKGSLKFLTL